MARIDGNGPKIPQSIQSLESPKPVVPAGPVAVPVPVPNLGLGSDALVGVKPRLANLTGGRGKAASIDTPAKEELLAQLKESMGNAGALPSSLQLKGGVEAKGETKAKPRSEGEILKSLEGKSRVDVGEAMRDMSAADRKTLTDGIKAGTVTQGPIVAAYLTTLKPAQQVAALKNLPDKALEGVKDVWRSGGIDSYPNVKTAVGIEMAARTPWGKDKANAGAIEKLRSAAGSDKIKSDLPDEHDAIATTTNGKIRFKASLLDNPEATAAILAHEGTHLHQGTDCCGGKGASSPQGETAGALAGIAVWDQLNKKNGNPAGSAVETLNKGSERLKSGGPKLVEQKVLELYRDNAKQVIADGKYSTKKGDTKEDWEAKVKLYDAELAKLKDGPGKAMTTGAIKGGAKGAD